MKHYHKRSNVKSTVNMVKAKLGDKLKSKNFIAQKNELLCKLIAHNIIVLIHEMHELGINPTSAPHTRSREITLLSDFPLYGGNVYINSFRF